MIRYIAYLKYVLKHKWYVFLACFKMRVPLWRAIIHDLSKFTLTEWRPYALQFFNADGTPRKVRDASGAYDPNAQSDDFKFAWLSHQRNKHHWEAWVSIGDGGNLTALPIPETYIREMIADWIGAGRAIAGQSNPIYWYEKNKDKIIVHCETRKLIEKFLGENHNGRK